MKKSIAAITQKLIAFPLVWLTIEKTILKLAEYCKYQRSLVIAVVDSDFESAAENVLANPVVQCGPFAGMRYPHLQSVGSCLVAKILGSYEDELHHVINQICVKKYKQIIDIGSAEGYYAVGLAMKCPQAKIYAFDINEKAGNLCREMAELNGCKNVITKSFCSVETIEQFGNAGKTLLICDCEGFEKEILCNNAGTAIESMDILVEVHDFIDIEISLRLRERFLATHDILVIQSDSPTKKAQTRAYPALLKYDLRVRKQLVSEWRPEPMEWFYMVVK
jgi:hypothetical protein